MASRDQTELQTLALWPIVLLVYLSVMLSVDFIWDDFVIGTDTVLTPIGFGYLATVGVFIALVWRRK